MRRLKLARIVETMPDLPFEPPELEQLRLDAMVGRLVPADAVRALAEFALDVDECSEQLEDRAAEEAEDDEDREERVKETNRLRDALRPAMARIVEKLDAAGYVELTREANEILAKLEVLGVDARHAAE